MSKGIFNVVIKLLKLSSLFNLWDINTEEKMNFYEIFKILSFFVISEGFKAHVSFL